MITQFKNINNIKNIGAGIRLVNKDQALLRYVNATRALDQTSKLQHNSTIGFDNRSRSELHIYSGETWITGDHNINIQRGPAFIRNRETLTRLLGTSLQVDIFEQFKKLNLTAGSFRIAVNFFKNLIGSYENPNLKIEEISPDRTEIHLRAIDDNDISFLQDITNFITDYNQTAKGLGSVYPPIWTPLLLNFSLNKTALFVNSIVKGNSIFVKLYEPLDANIEENFKCWIVEEQKPTYIDSIIINPKKAVEEKNILAGPNWESNNTNVISVETDIKNWNDILGSTTSTSQQLIDTYFSGSLSTVKLNINYSDFNNFIYYSSAAERLKNFKYKLSLLERYDSQIGTLNLVTGSTAVTNIIEYNNLKSNLIGGFDDFEKYLYYESSSIDFTHSIPLINANVSSLTGSYLDPIPKSNSTKPYNIYSISSSVFETWFNNAISNATYYDTNNNNHLHSLVPEFLKMDSGNDGLKTFINMLGHHYDILYTYINNASKIYSRDEHPKYGVPSELLYDVAKNFGWNFSNGNTNKDLWEYVLGTDETGIPITGSNSIGDPSVPTRDVTSQIWRRIINNLPLLLKSKGTKRSVQALLSCYGIPRSIISINEYGGPRIDRAPIYEKLNYDYALDLSTNYSGTIQTDYNSAVNSVELRFRTDNVISNPAISSSMELYTIGDNYVTVDFSSGTYGTISINGIASAAMEMFDGGWVNTLLRVNGTNLDILAKKSKYGKIISTVSSSTTASLSNPGTLYIGTATSASRLQGQLQELRLWSVELDDNSFNNHTKAPAAYDSNTNPYEDLLYRLPLTQYVNHTTTSSLSGYQPNQNSISSSFANWTNDTPYDSIEEIYYYDSISIGAGTFDDNKIRIESSSLQGVLDVKTRAERSQYDTAPLDSKKLGVYFSPQTMIDEDIIAHYGFTELDDYIGDPSTLREGEYPDLINVANQYWKKYSSKNDINSYLKIFSLFDLSFFNQLDQLLPARADKITGIVIQPNILERNKEASILPTIQQKINSFDSSIEVSNNINMSSEVTYFESTIEDTIVSITSDSNNYFEASLGRTGDEKYNGTQYSRDYRVLSASTYITASTPYWKSSAIQLSITGSTERDIYQIGRQNSFYNGTKMSSTDINVPSTDTIDGGPVIEVFETNPNQLIYQQNSSLGNFSIT